MGVDAAVHLVFGRDGMEIICGPPRKVLRIARLIVGGGLALAALCANPLRAQSSDAQAEPPQLRTYAFAGAELPAARPSSIADVILGIDGLQGMATVKRGQPKAVCPKVASARSERLQCELLGRAAELLTAANSSAIPGKLDTLDSWILAGRYDMGARFHALAEDYGGRHADDIRKQLRLGSIDFVQEAFEALDRARLKAPESKVSFVSGGGSFTFTQGAITIDTLGIKRLVVADFLFALKGFVRLSDCLSRRWVDARAEAFCNNVLERTRALEGIDKASFRPAKPGIDLVIGPGGTVGDLVASWRDCYGLSYAEAYFDEAWSYLSALSREAMTRSGASRCPSACAGDPAAYIGGARDALLRQMMFVIAHELSHQLLGHADKPTASEGSQESRCERALSVETQADVFGALLTRRVVPALADEDYWTWGPFFDGYVALFESARSRCGYFSGQARHIMFEVFYTDQSWD
jgi:hypothetical protein